jgi:hypothetical protein
MLIDCKGMATDKKINRYLICGPFGACLFIVSFTAQGVFRTDYNPFLHAVSSLAIGPQGWVQLVSFLLTGSLIAVFAAGIKSDKDWKPLPPFVLLSGIGLIGAGIFSTDPIYGYPPEMPFRTSQFTVQGHLHNVFSLLVVVCMPIACFKGGKIFAVEQQPRLALYSVISAVIVLLTFILAGMGFKEVSGLVLFPGLLQRISIIAGCTWLAVLGVYLIRKKSLTSSSSL